MINNVLKLATHGYVTRKLPLMAIKLRCGFNVSRPPLCPSQHSGHVRQRALDSVPHEAAAVMNGDSHGGAG